MLTNSAREQAYRTAAVLADQVESILKSNDQKEASLTASLKENYISKAKAVAYILDKNPEIELNIAEQIRIAKLMSIDEIHIFDESGTIYAGTVPVYYGYSFDSGEQMAFFKPMLENKALSMCQDVTPNTAEGKSMMYAICWNDFGTKMIQIGIEPVRLLEELRTNQISQVIADFPAYEGIEIIVADSGTCEVVGSTEPKEIGRSLKELGISVEEVDQYHQAEFSAVVNRVPCYCILSQADEYLITVAQKKADVHRDIPVVLMTMFLYLLLAAGVICFVIWKTARMIINEQKTIALEAMRRNGVMEPRNLEEQAQLLIGKDIYDKLIKGYTEKQWGRKCEDLPAFIIKRLPVRFVFDNNYFNDIYQGIPIGGYNRLIEGLLAGIETKVNTDFFSERNYWSDIADKIVFTGKLDEYYDYCFGKLNYRTVRFEHEIMSVPNYQGNAVGH